METEKIAVLIPIIFLLVAGLVLALLLYYNFRTKQLLVQKAGSLEDYKLLMESDSRRKPKGLLKTGIVFVFFGIGVGLGIMLEDKFDMDYMTPLSIFVMTGIGLILAHKAAEEKPEIKSE